MEHASGVAAVVVALSSSSVTPMKERNRFRIQLPPLSSLSTLLLLLSSDVLRIMRESIPPRTPPSRT
eukprot:CAMPEP_0196243150 /NCGR_PEP_ID=MMETSP0913-20130531/27099_1 /TAXON_ID=49265 /ORGANISM="Thalassiosira rotula, Strain GSO102" /LENGTH=66 /DNA_ID=CAMNT_0041526581 /DNA_START=258 /DNA_END=455 /DNA_ORIENTATION=+